MDDERSVPVGDGVLGRLLDAFGRPIDGGAALDGAATRRVGQSPPAAPRTGAMLETGIKAIDFYAPLTRGGVAVLEGRPGTGMIVVASELAYNMHAQTGGRTVMAVLDAAGRPARELFAELRSMGVDDATVAVAVPEADTETYGEAARTALAIAEHFAAQGHACLFFIDETLINNRIAERLRSGTGVTTLVWRLLDGEGEREPRIAEPDAVIVLRPELGRRNIWPAIDPLGSRSHLLDGAVDPAHLQAVGRVRKLLEQIDMFDPLAAPGSTEAGRARRALQFQTQPFNVAELFTARPGEFVDVAGTVDTFTAIADGAFDDVPESALYFIGMPAGRDKRAQ